MAGRAWWVYPFEAILWLGAMTTVMGWLARSRVAPANTPVHELRYPKTILIVGLFGLSLMVGFAVFAPFTEPPHLWLIWLGLFAFAVPCVYLIVDYAIAVFRIVPEGIEFRVPLQGRGSMRWDEIERVTWSDSMKWFVLRDAHRKLRVPATLYGLPQLARALLEHVPAAPISDDARELLRAAAAGSPPSVW